MTETLATHSMTSDIGKPTSPPLSIMKLLTSFLILFVASITLCLGDDAKLNLDDPSVRAAIEKKALDVHQVESRKENGQRLTYAINSQKPYTGWTKAYHGNAMLRYLCAFKDGREDGLSTEFHESGHKKEETNYLSGMSQGLSKSWYWNGHKKEEAELKDSRLNGLRTAWHQNGQVMEKYNYINGYRHGLSNAWYESGQKKFETYWKNHKWDGLATWWHQNGQKSRETNYQENKKHGLETRWDENGKVTSKTNWVDGKKLASPPASD